MADACTATPSRNFIVGAIIDALLSMLADFERDGFSGFREDWTALDALRDRPAQVLMGEAVGFGTAPGVGAHGGFRLGRGRRLRGVLFGGGSVRGGGGDLGS